MQPVMDKSRARGVDPHAPGQGHSTGPGPAAHLPSSDSACESEKRPAKGRERLQRAPGAGAAPAPRWAPVPASPSAQTPAEGRGSARLPAPAPGSR